MPQEITILDKPQLLPSSDYAYLRTKGLEYIEKLGSNLWTDYNIHDPGITLMELLSYAISDLGYRASLDTKDILTLDPQSKYDNKLQAFFTARDIMTISPLTQNDYRKLLIDIQGIKNGWMQCKSCGCGDHYLYADCKTSTLQYDITDHQITLKGMYDVLIEFEDEEGIGDLNNGKIKYNFPFSANGKLTNAVMEMRLPSWHEIELTDESIAAFQLLRDTGTTITKVTVDHISGNKTDDNNISQDNLANALRRPLYITMNIMLRPENGAADGSDDVNMPLNDVPATLLFHNDEDRKAIDREAIKLAVEDNTPSGILPRYTERIRKADEIIGLVRDALQANRNLCEDYCTIKAIQTEEVALCADIDVAPDADIEKVLAQIYYLADQYMSADVKFYSLKEMLDLGRTTDDIFDGPALSNGFIDNDQLETTQLKTVLHSSDLINMIMDVPGITAVRNFTLVKYDRDGNRSEAQSWSMDINYNHQPRLYLEGSRLVAYKNGLPFLPDKLELSDTLQIIKGQNIQPRYSLTDLDIAVPTGTYYHLDDYYPLQYSLPITYGVGEAGLPGTATIERKAQAKQLKAYLLFFEQMLVNYLEQLNHVKDFFSLDANVNRSYYNRLLGENDIAGVTEFYTTANGTINQDIFNSLLEDNATFLDRRNRFLEHLLSRFAEQFTDYTLMVYSMSDNKKLADEALIGDKIAFLKDYPFISANRARGVNYKDAERVCNVDNVAGLQRRVERLLGFKGVGGYITFVKDVDTPEAYRWYLSDDNGNQLLIGNSMYYNLQPNDFASAINNIVTDSLVYLKDAANYSSELDGTQWKVLMETPFSAVYAKGVPTFDTPEEAEEFIAQVVAFISGVDAAQRIYMAEHLLLRPRTWTVDPLLPICIPPDCNTCGEEDPYSFRMSIVMNGEEGIASTNMEFRRFAEETIRMETPAHISLKVCWVSTEQLNEFGAAYCAWLNELASEDADPGTLTSLLTDVLSLLGNLKNVYPPAHLHDCQEGSEESRVFLNHTII